MIRAFTESYFRIERKGKKRILRIDKTIKESEEATKHLLLQRKFKKFNDLKHIPKPDYTISNQENKVLTGKPKMSYAKPLIRNVTPLQNNEHGLNIQPRIITLKEQLTPSRLINLILCLKWKPQAKCC